MSADLRSDLLRLADCLDQGGRRFETAGDVCHEVETELRELAESLSTKMIREPVPSPPSWRKVPALIAWGLKRVLGITAR